MRGYLAILTALMLAACGDPLADVDRLSDIELSDDTSVQAIPEPKQRDAAGFLGRILGSTTPDPIETEPVAKVPPGGGGLRGLFGGNQTASSLTDVAFGTVLPFGEVARVCEAKGQDLGRKAGDISVRGYDLYDSAPNIISKRTFYVTGFDDGCPRQFTAATAIPAEPSRYEEFRYGPAGANLPYGATDKAYDKLKRSACGVGKRKPCGTKLDRSTFFISAYEFYGDNAQWSAILIHDGAVIATALKKR